jgi:hypothetical protein
LRVSPLAPEHRAFDHLEGTDMDPLGIAAPAARTPWPRSAWLLVLTLAAAAALGWHGPIAQWAHYHDFADATAWGGLPNAANVLSNLPFLLIGLWAAQRLRVAALRGPAHRAWLALAVAVACTAFGSALYHWAPSNATLVFDRLPIAWACASLLCALLAERVSPAWAKAGPLAGALLFASLAVAAWWWSGDLRLYVAVQFLPMLLVPAALALRLAPTAPGAVAGRDWLVVLALYAAAKGMEAADHAVLDTLAVLSGHTLKHLLAAAAAWWLLRAAISCGSRR